MLPAFRNRPLLLSLIAFAASSAFAQAPAAKPGAISCSIRRSPATPADEAVMQEKIGDALKLYKTESEASTDDGQRAHNALIRIQLRESDLDQAEKDARAWLAKDPKNPLAQDAVANVDFRLGAIDKAGDEYRVAITTNFCTALAHADYSQYLDFTGFHASAKQQIEIAHKLDGVDNYIHSLWLDFQPRSVQATDLAAFLKTATYITGDQRKHLEELSHDLADVAPYPCTLAKHTDSASIPFHSIHNGSATNGQPSNVQWGLTVNIDGKDRRLEIDSGASGVILTRAAAASLGLHVESHSHATGVDKAETPISIARVNTIKINGLEFQNCAVQVLDKDVMETGWDADRSMMEGQDGLIGTDVFQSFLVTLDFPGHVLKLDPLPAVPNATPTDRQAMNTGVDDVHSLTDRFIAPSMASWTKVFRTGHELFVPVRIDKGPTGLFLIDTGAGVEMVSTTAAKRVGKLMKGAAVSVIGVSGEAQNIDSTGALTLDFAGQRRPVDGLLAGNLDHLDPLTEVDGILGQQTLHQLTVQIDYRDQLVKFTFDPSRIAHCVAGTSLDDCY